MSTPRTNRSSIRRTLFTVFAIATVGLGTAALVARAGVDAKAPAPRLGTYDARSRL